MMGRLDIRDEMARNRRSSALLMVIVAVIVIGLAYTLAFLFAPRGIHGS